jgi:hypothetical protein
MVTCSICSFFTNTTNLSIFLRNSRWFWNNIFWISYITILPSKFFIKYPHCSRLSTVRIISKISYQSLYLSIIPKISSIMIGLQLRLYFFDCSNDTLLIPIRIERLFCVHLLLIELLYWLIHEFIDEKVNEATNKMINVFY